MHTTSNLSKWIALSLAAAYVAVFLAIAVVRLFYPYELEWIEGAMVDSVRRLLDGRPLYVAPSLDFVPFLYAPGYYYAAAGVAKLTGIGFFPLRLLSIASTIGTFAVIFLLVRRETGRIWPASVAVGVYAATFRLTSGWFDVGRVDSFYLFLIWLGIYWARSHDTLWAWITAGAIAALATLTKQTAFLIVIPVFLYGLFSGRRVQAVAAAAAYALICGGAILWFNWQSGGLFWYYAFAEAFHHPLVPWNLVIILTQDLFVPFAVALATVLAAIALPRVNGVSRDRWFYPLLMAGIGIATIGSRMKRGAFENDLMPLWVGLAICFGLALHHLYQRLPDRPRFQAALWIVVIVQFLALAYNPIKFVPTAADRRAGDQLIARVAGIPGDVLLLSHGFLPTLAGKRSHAHQTALSDELSAKEGRYGRSLRNEIREALQSRRYSAIILDGEGLIRLDTALFNHCYHNAGPVFDDPGVFVTTSGSPTSPRSIYLPSPEVPSSSADSD